MKLSLIVAMAENRTIGLNKEMPWHLSADLKKFKKITMGHPIIMGRKTFESIGKPLPGRKNIIISRNSNYLQEGCEVFNSLDSALESCSKEEEIFVIGGATLYESILEKSDRLYITEIKKSFAGDTWFPEFDQNQWSEYQREDIDNDVRVDFSYSFVTYDRK
jgi:dihydrofolate reductase